MDGNTKEDTGQNESLNNILINFVSDLTWLCLELTN